jgi:hypothetical protein
MVGEVELPVLAAVADVEEASFAGAELHMKQDRPAIVPWM